MDVYEVHCPEGVEFVLAALRKATPPYQVVIGPVDDHPTPAQRGMWSLWMDTLAGYTGESRGALERQLLAEFGPPRAYEVNGATHLRAPMFPELTFAQATAVMSQVDMRASWLECALPRGRR